MASRARTISKTISILNSHQLVFSVTLWLVAVCTLALVCQSVVGQSVEAPPGVVRSYSQVNEKWRVIPLRSGASLSQQAQHRKRFRDQSSAIRESQKIARNTLINGGAIAKDDPFFLGYVFPSMRVQDELVIADFGQLRAAFIKNYLGSKVNGKARTDFVAFTIANLQKIHADGTLHPANRLNAVYLMGMLDDVPAIRLEGQTPVPSKAARVGLGKILLSKDPKVPSYLKVAALAGIQRHLEVDSIVGGGQIPGEQKRALNQKCLELLNSKEQSPIAYWLKRRSMQVMGLIGDPDSAGSAVAVLKSDAGLWLKLDAVEALNEIRTDSLGPKKNLQAALAISDFVAEAIELESQEIQSKVGAIVFNGILQQNMDFLAEPPQYQSGGGSDLRGGAFGAAGGAGGGSDTRGGSNTRGGSGTRNGSNTRMGEHNFELPGYHLNTTRRRIKSLAYVCSQTLGGETGDLGLKQHVGPNDKALVKNVVDELNELLVRSNAGIIDLDNPPEPLEHGAEPPGTTTRQLTELCRGCAEQLARYLRQHRGEPEPVVAPGSDTRNPLNAKPAAGSDTKNPLDAGPAAKPAVPNPLDAGPAAEPDNPLDF